MVVSGLAALILNKGALQTQVTLVLILFGKLNIQNFKKKQQKDKGIVFISPLVTNFGGTYMSTAGNSSFWAISGDYLRIRSVELGHRFPEKWMSKVG